MIDWDSCVLWLDSKYFSESYWWDRSRYRNNGVVHGAKWKANAFYFGGSNTYVDCGNNESLDITKEITVEVLAKISDTSHQAIASKYDIDNSKRSWLLETYNGNVRFFISHYGSDSYYATNEIGLNVQQHLVGTFDGSQIRIYVNGVSGTPESSSGDIYSSDVHVYAGRLIYSTGNHWFLNGFIKMLRIFNRCLTETEIKILYNLTYRGL